MVKTLFDPFIKSFVNEFDQNTVLAVFLNECIPFLDHPGYSSRPIEEQSR